MHNQPKITPGQQLPDEIRELCERVNKVADGIPVLVYIPDSAHRYLYPLVIIREQADEQAKTVQAFMDGEKMLPPTKAMHRQNDLTLEAIHAAADYLPAIAFLPAGKQLHPVNLVAETVPDKLQPCFVALQRAQKQGAIGQGPIAVAELDNA